VEHLVQYSSFPTEGLVQVEARFIDLRAGRFPCTRIWLLAKDKLIAEFSLLEVLMPKGPLGTMPPILRKAFLTGQRFIDGAGIARFDGQTTTAAETDVAASNWLPGTIEQVYGYDGSDGEGLLERIVVAEHGSRILRLHPSRVQVNDSGLCLNAPLNPLVIESKKEEGSCSASGNESALDWCQIRDYWVDRSEGQHYLVHDLGAALIRQFVRHIVVEDPQDFRKRAGQPAIYLANHQLYVESFLFLSAIAAMTGVPAEAIAKKEHQEDWVGDVFRLAESELLGNNPMQILFLDRNDPADLLRILKDYGQTVADRPRSLLVHVEGTRARQAGQRTEKVSSVLVDLAIGCGLPIVPVRFSGGLPLEDNGEKFNFPVDLGKQDHYIGAAIEAEFLSSLPYRERTTLILDGINNLGPDGSMDVPLPGDAEFAKLVSTQSAGKTELQKVLLSAVQNLPELGDRMQSLLEKIGTGRVGAEKPSPAEAIAMKLLWTNH
jgi:1-acyl-sn-glycerol-3-phosphate acyltransferase